MTRRYSQLCTLILVAIVVLVDAWIAPSSFEFHRGRLVLGAKKDDGKGGYKFGDLTRALGRKVTGDQNYQFGDISKRLDKRAKDDVSKLTGKQGYKFGDLSRWADSQVKEKAANFTGKANYQVGDISKEVVRKVWAGEYDLENVVLMIRVLLQMGASFTPIARLLPVKVLLELLNVGLAQDVGSKVMGGVATSLDERFKEAVTGDSNYKLGDKSKEQLSSALAKFTGKDSYSFGDISQAVSSRVSEMEKSDGKGATAGNKASAEPLLELMNDEALKEWDRKLYESNNKKGS
ncbi:expressed unknown protein [Seminavis robusta]|uniref:Secreted RxLR effector peptide protein n=1 Tax=Seminavis robusta TaxID=568900 RepID=A0A9N8F536_9STRA|nr:expressed unknown protein [Seminavis robusta]|eukprot:Sro3199_g345050.1 n/a (291) ;mRNA; f:408-1606